MRLSVALALRLAACLCLVALAACDPPGPGAAGKISLPDGVATTGFSHIEVRAYPDNGTTFDPKTAPVADPVTLSSGWTSLTAPGPWDYEVSDGFGGSDFEHWRVVAWLAADDEYTTPATRVPAGVPYGTRTFTVDGCGIGVDGYCGTVQGVDLVLDQLAPE